MLDQTVACFMGIREGNDQFVLILKDVFTRYSSAT